MYNLFKNYYKSQPKKNKNKLEEPVTIKSHIFVIKLSGKKTKLLIILLNNFKTTMKG